MDRLRVAVLDDYQKVAQELGDWASLGPDASVKFFHDHLFDEEDLVERLTPFRVIVGMRERTSFPRSLIERLPNLQLLALTGRYRHPGLDLQACKDRGITVSTTGGISTGTAELTWALILELSRSVAAEDQALRRGRWQTTLGRDLHGTTLGVLGLGNMGESVARIGRAFGMSVIAWSQNLTEDRAASCGAIRVEKADLFRQADILTIHLTLSPRTRGIVGSAELALMKPSALLINTSRSAIVDNAALVEALRLGRLAGAGIDVFEQEPAALDDVLLHAPNTVLTPHIGYVTRATYEIFFRELVENIREWQAGSPIRVLAEQ